MILLGSGCLIMTCPVIPWHLTATHFGLPGCTPLTACLHAASVHNPAGKPLACGRHMCEKVCHAGPCGGCPFEGVRTCPCGKVS